MLDFQNRFKLYWLTWNMIKITGYRGFEVNILITFGLKAVTFNNKMGIFCNISTALEIICSSLRIFGC